MTDYAGEGGVVRGEGASGGVLSGVIICDGAGAYVSYVPSVNGRRFAAEADFGGDANETGLGEGGAE